MSVQVDSSPKTFEQFLEAVRRKPRVRLVKLDDFGFTEPEKKGGAWFMQPKVRITATAFDPATRTIVRWEQTMAATEAVVAGSGAELVDKKEQLKQRLELDGFNVAEGEWTPDTVRALLSAKA